MDEKEPIKRGNVVIGYKRKYTLAQALRLRNANRSNRIRTMMDAELHGITIIRSTQKQENAG